MSRRAAGMRVPLLLGLVVVMGVLGCKPKLPGPPPLPEGPAPGAGGAGALLPLVRQRVLEAHVLAARGEREAAQAQLERAVGLWPAGAAEVRAERRLWSPEGHEAAAAVLQQGEPQAIRETVLTADDPALLAQLAGGLHRPEWFARAPELVLLLELRAAVRAPEPERLRRLRHAAAVLGDLPRLARIPEPPPPTGPGLHCAGASAAAPQGEGGDASGYPVGNSPGTPRVAVPDAVAPAWAAYRAGRPVEARLLIDGAYRESGEDEGMLVWLRLIQGVPGEAALGSVP